MRPALALACIVTLLAGCTEPDGDAAAEAAVHDVYIHGDLFDPPSSQTGSLSMPAGDTLRFENHDPYPHTATIAGGLDSGDIPGNGGQHEFKDMQAGSYTFSCRHHPGMQVTVTVA